MKTGLFGYNNPCYVWRKKEVPELNPTRRLDRFPLQCQPLAGSSGLDLDIPGGRNRRVTTSMVAVITSNAKVANFTKKMQIYEEKVVIFSR